MFKNIKIINNILYPAIICLFISCIYANFNKKSEEIKQEPIREKIYLRDQIKNIHDAFNSKTFHARIKKGIIYRNRIANINLDKMTNSSNREECEEGFIDDCSGDGDCCSESWLDDGFADCQDPNNYGCDFSCYETECINDCDSDDDGDDDGDDGGDNECGDNEGTNLDWVGDGYCDGINNFEECEFDGGDCCESTCIPAIHDCSESGGDHGPCATDICIDPAGNNDDCEYSSDDGENEECDFLDCAGQEACGYDEFNNDEGDCDNDDGGDDGGDNNLGALILESGATEWVGVVPVPLKIESSVDIAGFQFTISDEPNLLNGVDFVSGIDCFESNSNDVDGDLIGVMFSFDGCVIESSPSSVQIGTLNFEIGSDAEFGQTVELSFTELIVSDPDGNSVQFGSINANILLGISGDYNMDGTIDITDVVSIITTILNPGSETQVISGDINEDGELNILDVVLIVNYILGDSLSYGVYSDGDSNAKIENNTLILSGNIGGIQADGIIISQIRGSDQLMENNGRSILFNMSGKLETKDIVFVNSPLNLIVADANGQAVSIDFVDVFKLNPVYPNPFNPNTKISYTIYNDGEINMGIYDIQGQLIEQLINQSQLKGNYELTWNADQFSSGIYFLKVFSVSNFQTEKLILIK